MRKKNYTFWLIFTYLIMAAVCAVLIIFFNHDPATIIINIAMFVIVAIIFAFSIHRFQNAWRMQVALYNAALRIKDDARADSRYLWEQYRKDPQGVLFPDNILSKQYQKFVAEMRRLEQFRNADYKCDIEDFINKEYVDAVVRKNLLNLVSGTMTGLGILGTFVGLSFGLQFFNTGTAAEITDSIAPLMQGIRVAFHTSIFGMVFSLVFSFVYKATMEAVYVQLDEFLSVFNTYVVGDAANDNESRMREMFQALPDALGQSISEQMSQSLAPIVYNMNKTMMDFAQTITDNQSEGLKGLVDEFISKLDTSMQGSISGFARVINDTCEIQKANNEYAQNIMEGLAQVSVNVRDINALSAEIINNISGYIAQIEKLQGIINENYNSTYNQMEALMQHEENMQNYFESISKSEKESGEHIKQELEEVIKMSRVFTGEIQNSSQKLAGMLDAARTELDSSAKDLAEASKGLDERLTNTLKESFEIFDSSMADAVASLSESVEGIEKASERAPQVVLSAYESMQQSFDSLQSEMNSILKALDDKKG